MRGLVERAIWAEASGEAVDDLLLDLYERLEDPDDLAGFAERPVARICRDLGLAPPKDLWDDAGWGIAEDEAAPTPHLSPAGLDPGWPRPEAAWSATGAPPGPTHPP